MRLDGPNTSAPSRTACASSSTLRTMSPASAEGATVEQASLDGAGVLRRVAEHLTRESIRLFGRRQRRVRLAAVLIDVGARQDRSHGLGMLIAECPAARGRRPPARRFPPRRSVRRRRRCAPGSSAPMTRSSGRGSPRARRTGMSRSSSARASLVRPRKRFRCVISTRARSVSAWSGPSRRVPSWTACVSTSSAPSVSCRVSRLEPTRFSSSTRSSGRSASRSIGARLHQLETTPAPRARVRRRCRDWRRGRA